MSGLPAAAGAASAVGPALCLTAAFLWAVSVSLFQPAIRTFGARTVNLAKCLLATLLQGGTVLAAGYAGGLGHAGWEALALLAASGLVGLVLGDTALFGAVNRIGPHRTLLLQSFAPVFAAVAARVGTGESLAPRQATATLVILVGVVIVVAPTRSPVRGSPGRSRNVTGLALALVAAAGQGGGIVLAKAGMTELSAVPASFVRLGTATLGLAVLAAAGGRLSRLRDVYRSGPAVRRVVPATLLGTYLALFLMMGGVALAPSAVAAVLLSTSPVFSLFLEAWEQGRPVPARGLVGTALAVAGVAWLSAG